MLDDLRNKRHGASGGFSSRPSQISPQIRRDRDTIPRRQNYSSNPQPSAVQREEQALKNRRGLPSSPQRQRYGSADVVERRSNPVTSNRERSPNTSGMSADAAERQSNPANSRKQTPNLRGMSADAAEAWSNPVGNREARLGNNRRPTPTYQPPSKLSRTPTPKTVNRLDSDRHQTGNWVTRTWNTASNWAQRNSQTISNVGHTVLDGAGFIPVVGIAADVIHAGWYAAEGNWTDAGLALGAAVPIVGDAVAAAKGARRIAGAANAVGRATNTTGDATTGGRRLTIEGRPPSRPAIEAGRRSAIVANVTGDSADAATTARRANLPGRERKYNRTFRNEQASIIKSDESHPLRFLLEDKGKLSRDVHAGHQHSLSTGRREMLALEDSSLNLRGKTERRRSIEIRGVPVEKKTAEMWESKGLLPQGTLSNAPSHPGWTVGVKVKPGAVDVVERHLGREIPRLRKIAETESALNRRLKKDRELYRLYTQALRDSVQQRKIIKQESSTN